MVGFTRFRRRAEIVSGNFVGVTERNPIGKIIVHRRHWQHGERDESGVGVASCVADVGVITPGLRQRDIRQRQNRAGSHGTQTRSIEIPLIRSRRRARGGNFEHRVGTL